MSGPARSMAFSAFCVAVSLGTAPAARAAWEPIGPESAVLVTSLAVDPSDPDVVFAGASDAGVYRSDNGCATWTPTREGLERGVRDLAIDPGPPTRLYAATSPVRGGIERSIDSGASWHAADESPQPAYGVATLPGASEVVFATGRGIFKSSDAGATWTSLYEHVDEDGHREVLCDVHVAGGVAPVLYASSDADGILRSADGGASWERVGAADVTFGCEDYLLAVAPADPLVLYVASYAGFQRSLDGGQTWSPRSSLSGIPQALAVDPADPSTLYVSTTRYPEAVSRLERSRDGGATFETLDGPWGEGSVDALAIFPSDSRVLYAATHAGVFRSSDAGESWSGGFAGMRGQWGTAVAVDTASPERVLLAFEAEGLQLSEDGGDAFARVGDGLDQVMINDVAFDSTRPGVVYLARGVTSERDGGIARSVDGGRSFGPSSAGLPFDRFFTTRLAGVWRVLVDPDGEAAYAFLPRGGVYRSEDGGAGWSAFDEGHRPTADFTAIALDPTTGTLYLWRQQRPDAAGGLLARSPGDLQWRLRSTSFGPPATPAAEAHAIAVDPTDPGTLYSGTGIGVFRSRDGGRTWAHASEGLPQATVTRLAVDPGPAGTVYAETSVGVFATGDSGDTWTDMSDGLHPRLSSGIVRGTLALDASSLGARYLGTHGGGAYRYRLPCAPGALLAPRLRIAGLGDPAGDERLLASASVELPPQARVDPASIGLRIRVIDASGTALADVNLPGGRAWRSSPNGRSFRRRVDIPGKGRWMATLRRVRDRLDVRLTGQRADLAAVRAGLPAALEIGFATSSGRTCARTELSTGTCRRENGGRRVRCG